jgi:methanethiol S-methyltransferase
MIEWLNLLLMLTSASMSAIFYVLSVSPANLEKKIGDKAYKKCSQYRYISLILFIVIILSYIIYYYYPIQLPIDRSFPWSWIISDFIAIIILLPLIIIYVKGVTDAGEETMSPIKDNKLYGGIYSYIRHPQAASLMMLGIIVSLFLNSPFLVILSFFWIPMFYIMCYYEEKDLILRYGKEYIDYMDRTGFFIPKYRALVTAKGNNK